MSYIFTNVNVRQIENKINLKENATDDGKNNLPRSTSETFSNCESEAIISADEFRNSQVSKAVDYLNSIKGKIIDSTAKLGQQHFYIDEFKNRIEQTLTTAEAKLSNLKSAYTTQNNEVRNFKLENKLNREPKSLTTFNIMIAMAVIAVLFYIELQVNANLLAPAMASGLKEGMAIAAAVAGLNVFVSFAVGFYALKNFHHVLSLRKNISKFGLSIYLIFITYLNWSLGAYRAIHEATGENLIDAIMGNSTSTGSTIVGNPALPWSVDLTFTSLILVFVGIGFALASLIDGYLFNDPYPGYGSVGKDRNENQKEINRMRQHLSSEITTLFKNEIRKTGESRDAIINNTLRNSWVPSITSLENTFEGYRRFADQLSFALDHTIGEYRSLNSMFRTDPEPKYWRNENGNIKTKFYELREEKVDPKIVFRDFAVLYLDKDQIEKKIENYQNKIQDESNDFINKLNTFNEETNKKIENMRSRYDIS
ncbi:hypothetical protein OAS12_01615 [Candidatus Pelagibacter ubique]|nr:hypothetical protein [Candidatus Pelagibacter ubique]